MLGGAIVARIPRPAECNGHDHYLVGVIVVYVALQSGQSGIKKQRPKALFLTN
jgi:hypothetical protein